MRSSLLKLVLVLAILLAASTPSHARDALRILITRPEGDTAASRAIQMRFFFEMIRAFHGSRSAERGAWVLYSSDPPERPGHQGAVEAAMWPSVRADIVIWGKVVRLHDGYVVQTYISRTPISYERNVQPDSLGVTLDGPGGIAEYKLTNSAAFFPMEPFEVSVEVEREFRLFQDGVPIYDAPDAFEPIDYSNSVLWFMEVRDDAVRVQYDGLKSGWLRYSGANERDMLTTEFGHGLVQVLRGDWQNAHESFTALLTLDYLPNELRQNAFIFRGIAAEKLGTSGDKDFSHAYALNDFDHDAARFHLTTLLRRANEPGGFERAKKGWDQLRLLTRSNDPMSSAIRRVFFP